MLELIRRYHNNTKEAAISFVEEFMRIPVNRRSDVVAQKVEVVVEKYRKRAKHLLDKDRKRSFLSKKRAHQLDDSFGKIDSHPSLFGTQTSYESWRDSSEDSEAETEESDDNMDDVDELSQRLSQMSPNKPKKKKKRRGPRGFYQVDKALNDPGLDDETRMKRLRRIRRTVAEIATKNGISLILLIGMVLKNETYIHDRQLARIADLIINGQPLKTDISAQEAIYLREECLLSQMTYFRLRQRLKAHGIDLPAEERYRDAARSMRPLLKQYQERPGEGPIGVKAHLKPSLEHTFKAIMEVVEKNKPDFQKEVSDSGSTRNVTAMVKFGLDGSGSHREIGKSKETNVISGERSIPLDKLFIISVCTLLFSDVWSQ